MRKLASVQVVKNLRTMENSDNLEVAEVLGWDCVVKKGELSVGQKVIYIEIDSVLPNVPAFEVALKYSPKRVKTVKLRGQISQGLVMPLSVIPSQGILY